MRNFWLTMAALVVSTPAGAQTMTAPALHENDTWVYQSTSETKAGWRQTRVESTVLRIGASSMSVSVRPVGSTMPATEMLTGLDWSRTRTVNGIATVVNRPLSFPLGVGQTWSVSYTERQPNRMHSSEHFSSPYRVTGWEDVTVPAGTFHAMKIECEGVWSAVTAPGITSASGARVDVQGTVSVIEQDRSIPHAVSGRTYKAFWYVPGVKKWAKSVEDYYDGNGVRYERLTDELQSYRVD